MAPHAHQGELWLSMGRTEPSGTRLNHSPTGTYGESFADSREGVHGDHASRRTRSAPTSGSTGEVIEIR